VRAKILFDEDHAGRREYAAQFQAAGSGMAAKSAEFRERGSEVYLPADVVASAEAEEPVAAD
jgi:hypothetical protein